MEKACKRPELYIKCSSRDKDCSCPTKKKKHYKKWKMSKAKSIRYSEKKWKYLRKKRRSGKKYKSSRCYICNRPGHFAKNCPRAQKQVSVYISKYAKPIKVIAFLDTGAAQTIMNPEVLPKECWKSHTKHFSTTSSEVFSTHLISRPLKIQFFPGCYLITRVLGSTLPRKDIVVGWDIITKQDLIESSNAPWACEAFYVNKRSEQLANGQYQPEPHVAQELFKYLEESLTKKQIQQFLGTTNYLRDFLPKIAKLTRPLEKMLKKDAPTWGPNQTKAIKELKAQL
ncbi:hypothetical protein CRG98_004323 [Punica granatum]|uniref:CCHC-type domain-containing protein n=1 Tax=Punica granatum TaxID=22663 RepID=A0A2I0L3S6_PUNGR|nr:hypothetical protein CRG98_004323 [Punica granatum]